MEIPITQLPPGDSRLIDAIVGQLKSKGIFDRFRKECLADVDTKPAFLNLRQRVDGQVKKFLDTKTWKNDLNKNQLRDGVRKNIQESGILDTGIDAIINQVVNPKIKPLILPLVEDTVYGFLQIEKPKREIQDFENPLQAVHHGQKPFYGYEPPLAQPYPPYPVYQEIPPPFLGRPIEDLKEQSTLKISPKVEAGSPNNDQESSIASESEISVEDKSMEDRTMDEPKPLPTSLPSASDILPMETDVISSGEDDILARGSPPSASSISHDQLMDTVKIDEDNAVDSFDTARGETDVVTSAVQKLTLKEDKLKNTEVSVEAQESEKDTSMPCLPLFDNQSLDSISSNTSGLSFSPTSGPKASQGERSPPPRGSEQPKEENSASKSLEDLRSTQSTPLEDEKTSSTRGRSASPEISKAWTPYTLPKDLPSAERVTIASFGPFGAPSECVGPTKVVEGASPVSAEEDSQGSLGDDSTKEKSAAEGPPKAPKPPKSDKSEGEITSTSSSSSSSFSSSSNDRSPKGSSQVRSSYEREKPTERRGSSSKGDGHSRSGHGEGSSSRRDRSQGERRHSRDSDRKSKPRHDDHSSHHDRDKHHRRDKDDDKDRDRHGKGHSSSYSASSSANAGRTSSSVEGASSRDRKEKGSERSSDHKSHSRSHSSSQSKSHSSSHSKSHSSSSHSKSHSSRSHSSKSSHSSSDSKYHSKHDSKSSSSNRHESKDGKTNRKSDDKPVVESKFEKDLKETIDAKREKKDGSGKASKGSAEVKISRSHDSKNKSSVDAKVKPVKKSILKDDNIFELHLSNDKKDVVLPKPTTSLNKLAEKKSPPSKPGKENEKPENKSCPDKGSNSKEPESNLLSTPKSGMETKKKDVKKSTESVKDSPSKKALVSNKRPPLKLKITLNGANKTPQKVMETRKSGQRKRKGASLPLSSSSENSSDDESSDETLPLLKKVTIPIFRTACSDAKTNTTKTNNACLQNSNQNLKRKRGVKGVSKPSIDSDDESDSSSSSSGAKELFGDTTDGASDFEGFGKSKPKMFSKKSTPLKRSLPLKRKKSSPKLKPLKKQQLVVECDDSSSSDMEISIVNFCQKSHRKESSPAIDFEGFMDEGFEDSCSGPDQRLRDYLSQFSLDSTIRLNDFIKYDSDDDKEENEMKCGSTVFSLNKNTTKSVIEEIAAQQIQNPLPKAKVQSLLVESMIQISLPEDTVQNPIAEDTTQNPLQKDSMQKLLPGDSVQNSMLLNGEVQTPLPEIAVKNPLTEGAVHEPSKDAKDTDANVNLIDSRYENTSKSDLVPSSEESTNLSSSSDLEEKSFCTANPVTDSGVYSEAELVSCQEDQSNSEPIFNGTPDCSQTEFSVSEMDSRKPLKKRKLSGLSSGSLSSSSSSSSPKMKRKSCPLSDKAMEDFASKDLVINSYSLLTPEEDRSLSKDYDVDISQREASYIPLSPASDTSEEIKTKLKNNNQSEHATTTPCTTPCSTEAS